MSNPVDEILAALPSVGMRLVSLQDRAPGWWACLVEAVEINPGWDALWHYGTGPTPADALCAALACGGIQVSNDSR